MELIASVVVLCLPLLILYFNERGRRIEEEGKVKKLKKAILIGNAMSAEQLDKLVG